MGYPMAMNLRKKIGQDKSMVICDTATAPLERFRAETENIGPVSVVANGAEAYEAADTIITMLPSAEAMSAVYASIFSAASRSPTAKKLIIECGTVAQSTIWSTAEQAKQYPGITFCDAPVSGGPMGSEAGTLSLMVGCDEKDFPTIKKLLSYVGKPDSIVHCGPVGSGTAFKLINNYISLTSVVAVSEALNIASKMDGIDMRKLVDVINSSSGQCWVTSTNNPVPGIHPNNAASNGYIGGFRLDLAEKVMGLGTELAEMVGAPSYMGKKAVEVYHQVGEDKACVGKDARIVYKWLGENSGT